MSQPSKRAAGARVAPAAETGRLSPGATILVAILVPGAGHVAHGKPRKAVVFFAVLLVMFLIGLGFGGRLFPMQMSDPLVLLAALAEWAIGLPRVVAAVGGYGAGEVVAATYEYGNTFLIACGLMNLLVVLDAVDLSTGRKS